MTVGGFAPTTFLLTPLREGRPGAHRRRPRLRVYFYSRPCGRGDSAYPPSLPASAYFYSRPCGRGDNISAVELVPSIRFLLTPLREGRPACRTSTKPPAVYFYSRPCGRGDDGPFDLLEINAVHFYSRPCGRGDGNFPQVRHEVLRQIAER